MAPAYFFVFFALSNLVLLHSVEEEIRYDTQCPPFHHVVIGKIGFLFINSTVDPEIDCSWFAPDNCGEPVQRFQLEIGGNLYDVLSIYPAGTVDVLDMWFREHFPSCTYDNFASPILPPISFKSTPNLTLLACDRNLKIIAHPYYSYPKVPKCISIALNMKRRNPTNYGLFSQTDVNISFQVHVSGDCRMCYFKEGECRNNDDGNSQCDDAGKKPLALKLGLALGTGCLAILTICFFLFLLCCNKQNFLVFGKKETQNHQSVEVFLRNCGSLAPKRYSYSTVKEMTNSFKDKLGQGGYGGVYKGKLHDGRLVAVKVLIKSKGDGEEFINEVASISRTSHVNNVTLLGFCFEGSKRALIYEFMPNGSLEKFIYKNLLRKNRQLGWETLHQIAIGIARGLEYLHRGCNTRILHFDIKPHNILLDEDFCPKIADFGLAKLCPKKESIISMQGARGTAGYIAPEVFSRHFGGVSHKSDVYSYGMMVLEMVGGRNNIDVGVDHTSKIYFPHWIYKRLHEQGDQLGLHGVMNEEENEKVRKMILVGLWCIQTDPSNRPPMSRVVDMLQGSLGSLQIPPKPFLSSPPRSPADSITTHIMTL